MRNSLLFVLALACAACEPPSQYLDTATGEVIADSVYQASVDEGFGASVAIFVDRSGSMGDAVDGRPKWDIAKEALVEMLTATDSFAAARPDYPVNVGVYLFSDRVTELVPMGRYDGPAVRAALAGVGGPDGGTAIGSALYRAKDVLFAAGTFRKYILVITDGENTNGPGPDRVAEEIWRRSEGGIPMYFVAFDVSADHFDFVRNVGGEVFSASGADNLRSALDEIYRGRILAEDPTGIEPGPDTAAAPSSGGD